MASSRKTHGASALAQGVKTLYAQGQSDYALEPIVLTTADGKPLGRISGGDGVIFCCRRGEREVELTEAFTETDFPHFPRTHLKDLEFVILTLYHEKFKDLPVAFAPSEVPGTLGEVVSRAGLRQLRTAESEKFAHVTFFLNGGRSQPFTNETRVRIPSPAGIPYDQVPELSLAQVRAEVQRGIASGFDLICANFANGDVIGHTANNAAKLACVSIMDGHIQAVVEQALAAGYVTFLTADHGNLEEMIQADGSPHVAHTTNPVDLIVVDGNSDSGLHVADGRLADVAPTILAALGVPAPAEMNGKNLVTGAGWQKQRKVLLLILDGWGIGRHDAGNPIHLAQPAAWLNLLAKYPHSRLLASGEAVGLQPGKAGNSEAGHMNLGAGQVVLQDDVRLEQALRDGTFTSNVVFARTMARLAGNGGALHLIGLLTEKSSHGSIDYPLALARMAKMHGLEKVFLHIIFDGRSTAPGSAPALLEKLETQLEEIGCGQVVSGIGRGIALDRNGDYSKIQKAYQALVHGTGMHVAT